jgi:hypothetical protein
MKKSYLIIGSVFFVLLAGLFLFFQGKTISKTGDTEIITFLNNFNSDLQTKPADSLLKYFDSQRSFKEARKVTDLLQGKDRSNRIESLNVKATLLFDQSKIRPINSEITEATLPVNVKGSTESPSFKSQVTIMIRTLSPGHFQITNIDGRHLIANYRDYKLKLNTTDESQKIVYSPSTLEAFKNIQKLKSRYDSVLWFAHAKRDIYYYVIKGFLDEEYNLHTSHNKGKIDTLTSNYKMGLVGPDLKELIPVKYDLIYVPGETFAGLIEVEKYGKKGFYNMAGKLVIPVDFDQIFPLRAQTNLAALRTGDKYFYLKPDFSIQPAVDLKVADLLSQLNVGESFTLANPPKVVVERNSSLEHDAINIIPSYLKDLGFVYETIQDYKNPFRKIPGDNEYPKHNLDLTRKEIKTVDNANWLTATFYNVKNYFLGGRDSFYEDEHVIISDANNNRVYNHEVATDFTESAGGPYEGVCGETNLRLLGDSILEVKTGANYDIILYNGQEITGGTHYLYFRLKGNKLTEMRSNRIFEFTKFVKMDDSYLQGCYELDKGKHIDHATAEMLRYIKNEIYASYHYNFKDPHWNETFMLIRSSEKLNKDVTDSLTTVDKYNIQFIDQKLSEQKSTIKNKVLAAQ